MKVVQSMTSVPANLDPSTRDRGMMLTSRILSAKKHVPTTSKSLGLKRKRKFKTLWGMATSWP